MQNVHRRIARAALYGIAVCVLAGSARAGDQVFYFTYNDPISVASGSLTATDNGNGSYTVHSGYLDISSGPLMNSYSLWDNPSAPSMTYSPMGTFAIDNQLFPDAPTSLNSYGLLFVGLGREINIWGNGGQPYSMWSTAGSGYDYSKDQGAFTLTAGPGPASVASPAAPAALAAFGMLAVRRQRKA